MKKIFCDKCGIELTTECKSETLIGNKHLCPNDWDRYRGLEKMLKKENEEIVRKWFENQEVK